MTADNASPFFLLRLLSPTRVAVTASLSRDLPIAQPPSHRQVERVNHLSGYGYSVGFFFGFFFGLRLRGTEK